MLVLLASGGQGYLRIVAPDMTEGDYVEIQCEGAAPGDEGLIQWYFNNQVCINFYLILNIKIRSFKRKVRISLFKHLFLTYFYSYLKHR